MRVFLIVCFVVVMTAAVVVGQTPDGALTAENLEKNNAEVVRLFQRKEYDKALPLASKSLEMAEKLFGKNHIEMARALRTMGYLQYLRGDEDKAEISLDEAFAIYQKQPDLGREEGILVAKLLEVIAGIKYKKNPEIGESSYKLALEWRQKYNGKDSAETLAALIALANISYTNLKFDAAAELFLSAVKIEAKFQDLSDGERRKIFSRCDCAYRKAGKMVEFDAIRKLYEPNMSGIMGVRAEPVGEARKLNTAKVDDDELKAITGGVVSGKAISLPAPIYPAAAKKAGAKGTVIVQVLINEAGDV